MFFFHRLQKMAIVKVCNSRKVGDSRPCVDSSKSFVIEESKMGTMIHSFFTITECDYEVVNVVQRYNISHFSTVYFFCLGELVHNNPDPRLVGSSKKPRALDETRCAIHARNLVLERKVYYFFDRRESSQFFLILVREIVEPVWDATYVNPYVACIRLIKARVSWSTIRAS